MMRGGGSSEAGSRHFAIDSHAHVFHRGLTLAPGRRYAPDYEAPLDLYLRELDANGMSHGVLVQPSFLGTDNAYLVDCLEMGAGRLRGIAVVEPGIALDRLRALDASGVVGIRLNLVGQPLRDLDAAEWTMLLTQVRSLGWQVEVQRTAGDLAKLAPRLLDHGVTVVLDHVALPDPTLGVADPGFQALLRLGETGRLWVKLSAPYRNGPNGRRLVEQAYPLLRNAFGVERLMWGSDWPHTQFEASQDYRTNRRFLDELVPEAGERAALLAAPRALFRFA